MLTTEEIDNLIENCENSLAEKFRALEKISLYNQEKVLNAFRRNKIALRHFAPSTGYGYGDEGRDTLNKLFGDIFGAEKAVVSPNIVSGTHALSLGLSALLRPEDGVLFITGKPYDTLIDVIEGDNIGSLKDYGVRYRYVDFCGSFALENISAALREFKPQVVFIQRSRGYEWRNALTVDEIQDVISYLRKQNFNGCVFIDNCYGEFTDVKEPTEVGADVIAGSLIKNPGGGLVPTGGYLAGKAEYIDKIINRLTAPSIGGEVGSYIGGYQYFYQGVFSAPHVVCQALKGALLIGKTLNELGYETSPDLDAKCSDLIRAVKFNNERELISFIQSVQEVSPVDSFVTLEPWYMPGYNHKVIMAAGCFIQGASVELSADAPIKEPYIAYLQGGLTYEHCVLALKNIIKNL